jgi:hypothetical protein
MALMLHMKEWDGNVQLPVRYGVFAPTLIILSFLRV